MFARNIHLSCTHAHNFVYKENGRGMVSVSKTVDCAVCCCFPLLPPFLFLPFDLQLRMKIGKKPTVAAEWNHRGNGPSATASFDEGRSGSAGSNISHAVKPFLFSSPKAAAGEIAFVAISSRPAVVGRVGDVLGLEGKVNCRLVGSS